MYVVTKPPSENNFLSWWRKDRSICCVLCFAIGCFSSCVMVLCYKKGEMHFKHRKMWLLSHKKIWGFKSMHSIKNSFSHSWFCFHFESDSLKKKIKWLSFRWWKSACHFCNENYKTILKCLFIFTSLEWL